MIKIIHNPRCGKSRNCKLFLEDNNIKFDEIKYLDDKLTFEELKNIIEKLGIQPIDLIRKKESIWIENYKNTEMNDDEVIKAMITHPILIERPIVIDGDKAIIGRDLDKLKEFFLK